MQLYLAFWTSRKTSIRNKKTYYMPPGFAGRHVVGFVDLIIDVFLEVQNMKYSQIDHIAYGIHL